MSEIEGDQQQQQQTEKYQESYAAQRFPAWIILAVFSAICLIATVTRFDIKSDRGADVKWVMTVTILSMFMASAAVGAYLFARALFVSQLPEGALIGTLIALWAAGLPVIMNPGKAIAVKDETVESANLYFCSWGCFAACLYLLSSYSQENFGLNIGSTPGRSARWYGLCAASLVVMGASVRLYAADEALCNFGKAGERAYCRRTKLGISVGTISFLLAAIASFMSFKNAFPLLYDAITSTLLLVIWCFAVGYITFGEGSGSQIGNLYFGTWMSFLLTVFIFGQNFRDYMAQRAAVPEANDDVNNEEEDV